MYGFRPHFIPSLEVSRAEPHFSMILSTLLLSRWLTFMGTGMDAAISSAMSLYYTWLTIFFITKLLVSLIAFKFFQL